MCDENESTIKKAFDLPVAFCVANQHYLKEMLQVSFDFLKYFNENNNNFYIYLCSEGL